MTLYWGTEGVNSLHPKHPFLEQPAHMEEQVSSTFKEKDAPHFF